MSNGQRSQEPQEIEYAVHDGLSLKALLYSPSAAGRYPAVLAIHGGGWRAELRQNYRYLGPWLAEQGYVVLAITYRLSKPGQKSFPEAVHDVRAAIQFAKGNAAKLNLDPERIALMGDSAGGHLSSLVALAGDHPLFRDGTQSDPYGGVSTRVKAVVPIYAVFDLAQQWRHDHISRPRDHISQQFVGVSLTENRRTYFDASPLSYVSVTNNSTAFLVVWSTEDDIVSHKYQSEVFLEALKQSNYYVRSVVIPGAPHFWIGDPLDEEGSYPAFFAPRLLRFLRERV